MQLETWPVVTSPGPAATQFVYNNWGKTVSQPAGLSGNPLGRTTPIIPPSGNVDRFELFFRPKS
jgi:hypothetical protein